MFDLIYRSGIRTAFSYSDIRKIIYDPKEGITITLHDAVVVLSGYGLTAGYERFRMHR